MIVPPLLVVFLAFAAACCTTGSRARRVVGVMLGVSAILPPWLLPEHPRIVRAVMSLIGFVFTMRVIDLAGVKAWPLSRRLLHVASVIDSRKLVRRGPRFELVALLEALAWLVAMGIGLTGMEMALRMTGPLFWITRWGAGLIGVYAVVSALYRGLFVGYSLLGFDTPPLHLFPIASRSVQEFWGERWARPISDFLGLTFFRPWARKRKPLTGVLLAFLVSAAFHAYAIWIGLGFVKGLAMAGLTLAYFVTQGIVMALERALRVRTWSPFAGHAWTIAWMIGLSPLFVEPAAQLVGP